MSDFRTEVLVTLGELTTELVDQSGPSGDFVYIDISGIDRETKTISDPKALTLDQAPSRAKQVLKAGDVLVSMTRPNLNAVALVPEQLDGAIGSTGFHVLRSRWLKPEFLFALVQTHDFIEAMTEVVQGALYPAVRPRDICAYSFSFESPAQQTRIVEKLEELLEGLDAGVAELKAAQKKLAQYRQSLLKAAVEGALTAEWRQQNPPAETGAQLLARILTERRARWEARQLAKFQEQGKAPPKDWQKKYPEPVQPDTSDLPALPQGWVWASLGQLGDVTTGFTPSTTDPSNFGGAIPFVKPTDLDAGHSVVSSRETLSERGATAGRILPAKSVLVTCIGATIGKTGLARVPCATNQQINAVSVQASDVVPEFVYWAIVSGLGQRQIISNASATTLPILNKSKFEKLALPLPPTSEQQQAVSLIELEIEKVEAQSLAIALALKQSTAQRQNILRAAFAGQLVPQDPADEPASVLLERIRAERVTRETPRKPRKPKKEPA